MPVDRVIVIGGGAAGFFGAIAAAEANPEKSVLLLEAGREPLQKVRISGGGRCNVTHACFEPALLVQNYPRGGKALRGALSRFQPRDTVTWFAKRGVKLKTEADGRMFPVTDDSATIVDCLMQSARDAGVRLQNQAPIVDIKPLNPGFEIQLKSGETWQGDRLLLATGSNPQGLRLAQKLGHTIEPPVPSLFTFNIADGDLRELAGVSVASAKVKLSVASQSPLEQVGPLLITHWGLSGPAILKLSAWGARLLHDSHYRASLQVNWLAGRSPEQIRQWLAETRQENVRRAIATIHPPELSRRLWRYLIQRANISEDQRWAELSKVQTHALVQALSACMYTVQGKGAFKDEFVTCGGVRLSEVNFKTMESRLCPGLHFAGEILDIDGVTGGFNFQSAWTTGWLAGQAMSQ
ncbi:MULTISPECIES: aminoacetone oxidase family FAD-binding enzyme [unclassified Leptolyngbya]|uniref:aminoacetone oxidase family FAD-binding enzyme n=1 Tax=unclassified Leptolyngbya TaxID=2650499 RepID=UPI001683921B|nr:NAD(P)/FAD-dependent oxidoreductase [Leptolyngbya sp. FACHB-8]MBD2153768.1 NAD(P)/FAD-dependent oxidoreductase [Leptolyngbya sp. FACHB-16]